jgi:hypothetical protein
MEEIWKDIPGYEGIYQVSDQGEVRSFVRGKTGTLLRPGRMPGGHLSVALGRGNSQCVHKLVLIAFIGPAPEKHECRHLNGVPSDNRLANLTWGTRGENTQDKKWHGGNGKLTVEQVKTIKTALAIGGQRGFKAALARKHGVSNCVISDIIAGRYYRDV